MKLDFLTNKKILITGGTGSIGSLLVSTLIKSKCKVIKNVKIAIQRINEKLDWNDSLVIMGSHYLGNSIQRVYKKSFDSL